MNQPYLGKYEWHKNEKDIDTYIEVYICIERGERVGIYLGSAAMVSPGAPSGGVRVADVVGQVIGAGTRSSDDALQEF